MSSEKQNKGWKENFLLWEKAGGNPGQYQDLLWEKLQTRLQPRRRTRKVYFRAAVLFLSLAVGSFLFFQKRQPAAGVSLGSSATTIHVTAPAAGEYRLQPLPVKSTTSSPAIHHLPAIRLSPDDITTGSPALTNEPVTGPDTAFLTINKPPNPQAAAVPVQPTKKLRVVHLNEWNAPPPPTYATLKEKTDQEAPLEITIPGRSLWPGKQKARLSSAN